MSQNKITMATKNPRKWRFTWEAQSHSPALKLFVFDSQTHTNPSIQFQNLKVTLNLSKFLVSITWNWTQQQDSRDQVSLLVPIPKVLIDPECPVSCRALSDHIEVKLVLLLPVDHPIVTSSDSVLRFSVDSQIDESDASTPLVIHSDVKCLSSKKGGVNFYCRNCRNKLTKRPIRNFVEMPSANWQEAADNWFGGCCCSFGGISEKLVNRYANCYTCATDMCLLNYATVTLFKDDLVGCNFPEGDGGRKHQAAPACAAEDGSCGSTLDSGSICGKTAGCNDKNDIVHDFNGKLKLTGLDDENFSASQHFEVNEEETNGNSLCCMLPLSTLSENVTSVPGCCAHATLTGLDDENFSASQHFEVNEEETNGNSLCCMLPLSTLSENVTSVPGCCAHATHEILDHIGEDCKHSPSKYSSVYEKTKQNTELMVDQRSFLNGLLGTIFMARSYNLSQDIEWIEFLCPCCSSLLGAYPSSSGDAPIDGGVRLFKCYIATCLPSNGSNDVFQKYTLGRMFTNQLLESAKDELSFRTVARDLKTKSPVLQIVLLNPNAWCCTGYCSGTDSTFEPISNLDLRPIIKVLFSDCSNNSESQSRILEDWLTKNLADEVFMLKLQIEELIKLLVSAKDTLPPSYTSIEGLHLSSLRR